jgi:biopolymer transport protein ExbD
MHSEINVTPLVDVCLVLLIIFMVVLPSMVNGVDVTLPETKVTAPVAELAADHGERRRHRVHRNAGHPAR